MKKYPVDSWNPVCFPSSRKMTDKTFLVVSFLGEEFDLSLRSIKHIRIVVWKHSEPIFTIKKGKWQKRRNNIPL